MKTLLTYDLRIQQTVIILFMATIFAVAVKGHDFLYISIFIEFFLVAVVQYSLNMIKLLSKEYPRRNSRKVYIFVSTYVVVTFLFFILCRCFEVDFHYDFPEWVPISWIALSPVLIIQSLVISFYDKEDNKTKNHV